ncbi:hypothetical protein FQR65_LT04458 [Abscondita terminalis]|nr:hypothetical protein FQR65_LT04458 [Abscondita terminalis]
MGDNAKELENAGATSYEDTPVVKYFECNVCNLKEAYEYFGKTPPFVRSYVLEEDSFLLTVMILIRNGWMQMRLRWCSSTATRYVTERLNQRSLIRVAGPDVAEFLQGLTTNDIHHLDHGIGCMYTMFLNTKGRVMFDSIVYKRQEDNTFYIECDSNTIDRLKKHLSLYRVRKKIDITSLQDEFQVYSIFNPEYIKTSKLQLLPDAKHNDVLPETSSICKEYKDLSIYRDPRVAQLGLRVIAPLQSDIEAQISEIFKIDKDSRHSYRYFRYSLGVGEGIEDLPMDNSFPLESNCDYLHGISFHKGCYIGQELTARTHHTGVVRKRLMPLYFTKNLTKEPENKTIVHEGVNLGKLRGLEEDVGLGLLRVEKTINLKEISVGNGKATTFRPPWWPFEAPKERVSIQKT